MKTYSWPKEMKAQDRSMPDGPWMNEIDKAVWIDEATGLDCMIVRGPLGALCGYVGVPTTHPSFGFDYDGIPVDVHGGLTFSSECRPSEDGEAYGICHTAEPGRPDHVWWFGFDCSHHMDLVPGILNLYLESGAYTLIEAIKYRTVPYVQAECTSLAEQLAKISE